LICRPRRLAGGFVARRFAFVVGGRRVGMARKLGAVPEKDNAGNPPGGV
jgi:hypothetical protein